MKRFLLAVGILLLASAARAAEESPAEIFQKANTAYRSGDPDRATRLYESIASRRQANADVYYNLGNAYFKQKKTGRAILSYERARRLDPRDRDIAANLAFTRGLLEYRVEDKRNWYLKMGGMFLSSFTREETAIGALAFSLIFWLGWSLQLFTRPLTAWGRAQKIFLVTAVFFTCLWAAKEIHLRDEEAVVLKPQADVRYGPSYKDQVAFRLGEGIKVRLKKKTEEWSRVLLTNGETGWILNEEIGVI